LLLLPKTPKFPWLFAVLLLFDEPKVPFELLRLAVAALENIEAIEVTPLMTSKEESVVPPLDAEEKEFGMVRSYEILIEFICVKLKSIKFLSIWFFFHPPKIQ
jgi:hypothetical protein